MWLTCTDRVKISIFGSGLCCSRFWKGRNEQSASTYRQCDKQAIPLVRVVQRTGNPRSMQHPYPQKEHESKQHSRDAKILSEGESDSRCKKGSPCRIRKKQTKWHPGRDQTGNKAGHLKMSDTEDEHRDG